VRMSWLVSFVGVLMASAPGLLGAQTPFLGAGAQVAGPPVGDAELAIGIETRGRFGGRLTGTGTNGPWLTADLTYRLSRLAMRPRLYALGGVGFRITIGRNADPELNVGVGARVSALRLLAPFAELRLRHALRTAEVVNRLTDTVPPNTLLTVMIGLQLGGIR